LNPERWQQIEQVFQAAVEIEPAERTAFLERACSGDLDLLREVESLLAKENEADTLLTTVISAAAQSLSEVEADNLVGRRIGPYRVTGLIGEGGMAEVVRATRDDDEYQKQVAIKLVKRGMATNFMLGRFRHERQILASLEHPHIARLLEGGTTDEGFPYLVMEYIEGQPITDYCSSRKLSIKQRLNLFRNVCEAVQYAHRNLVIHRDLKPSNILVTTDCVPKLLDFGIAKLLDPELSPGAVTVAQTLNTGRLMTPHYASPEQVRGEMVTTATDIYSLGAVLYEMLTGERPHKFKNHSFAEIERVVCQAEVERPSEVAGRMKDARARLKRELAGDIDNIVLMAMRKEPERRYQSVDQLSDDIRRSLKGRAVQARQDTLGYRTSKFVRRHKVGMSIAALLLVVLVGVATTMTIQATRIAQERDRANRVTSFLVELFGVSDPGEAKGSRVTAREILDKGAEKIDRELKGQPEVRAALMDTMGRVYQKLGLYQPAFPLIENALTIRRQTLGDNHAEVATSLSHLAELLHARGDLEQAERLYREALAMRRRLFGKEHSEIAASLNSLAVFLMDKAEYLAAEPLFHEALGMRRRLLGDEHPDVAATMNELAVLLKQKGDYDAAEPLYREALAMRRRLLGEEHPDVAISLNNLAVLLENKSNYEEAEPLYRQALALSRRVLGEEHPYVATNLNNLANVRKNRGDYNDAESMFREALALKRKILGAEHQEVAIILNNLAGVLRLKGDNAGAESLFRESVEMKRKLMGPSHPSLATSLQNLAGMLQIKGEHKAAEPLLKEALQISEKSLGANHWMLAESRSNYGACLAKLGRFREAEQYLLGAHPVLKATLGEAHKRTEKAVQNIIELYQAWGKAAEADSYRALLQNNQSRQ
jgi:eukaryotic-like serine/threonine-protein kinase